MREGGREVGMEGSRVGATEGGRECDGRNEEGRATEQESE